MAETPTAEDLKRHAGDDLAAYDDYHRNAILALAWLDVTPLPAGWHFVQDLADMAKLAEAALPAWVRRADAAEAARADLLAERDRLREVLRDAGRTLQVWADGHRCELVETARALLGKDYFDAEY